MSDELVAIEPSENGTYWRQEAEKTWERFESTRKTIFRALYPDDGSNLFAHAKRELELADIFDKDADYDGALGNAVLDLMRVFCSQGHSGFSAGRVRWLFGKLANYETLTKNDHSQYRDVSDEGKPSHTLLQDVRDSRWFSDDGGQTWRNVETKAVEVGATATTNPAKEGEQ